MEVGLKWVHMARYELILRLDGAQKYGGHFSEKKKRLRQRSQPFRASKKSQDMGTIILNEHP